MASYNRITLMGNLTRDPELRFTQSGVPVANFGLAVNNPRSKDEETDFFDCTAWRGVGETIANYKQKGEPVLIEGRVKFEQYTDKQGNARSKHIVVVENVQFLSSGNGSANGSSAQPAAAAAPAGGDDGEDYSDIPF